MEFVNDHLNKIFPGYGKFHILFLFFVSTMFGISLCSLLGYHIHLVLNNRSTLEAFRGPVFRWSTATARFFYCDFHGFSIPGRVPVRMGLAWVKLETSVRCLEKTASWSSSLSSPAWATVSPFPSGFQGTWSWGRVTGRRGTLGIFSCRAGLVFQPMHVAQILYVFALTCDMEN